MHRPTQIIKNYMTFILVNSRVCVCGPLPTPIHYRFQAQGWLTHARNVINTNPSVVLFEIPIMPQAHDHDEWSFKFQFSYSTELTTHSMLHHYISWGERLVCKRMNPHQTGRIVRLQTSKSAANQVKTLHQHKHVTLFGSCEVGSNYSTSIIAWSP